MSPLAPAVPIPNRPLEITGFLEQSGWGDAQIVDFDGDFSPRQYARLTQPSGATAILMDADADQRTPQFIAIAKLLREARIVTPQIYAADEGRGLVLLQDFGSRNVGKLLDGGEAAAPFLRRGTEILAQLHTHFNRIETIGLDLPLYNADLFTAQAELFLDAYFIFTKQRVATDMERHEFRAAWLATLRPIEVMPKSLLLRDYMPDNLMELPSGELGVLDFQDAGIGPIAYDLSSLCEELRRDGNFALLPEMIAHYREKASSLLTHEELLRACTIMAAQRATRFLGIIAQQAIRYGRFDKLALLPRIQNHLTFLLHQPYLRLVRVWMEDFETAS